MTGTGQFNTTLAAIQAEHPDGIYYVDRDASRAGFFSLMAYNLSMTDVIMGWTYWDSVDDTILNTYVSASDSPAAENDYVALLYCRLSDMPGWTTYSADYIAAGFTNYGIDPHPVGAFAYDAANIIIEALQRAGNVGPPSIRDEIAATQDFEGVVGTYFGFDQYGDVIPPWSWIERYLGGQWHRLSPAQVFLPAIIK